MAASFSLSFADPPNSLVSSDARAGGSFFLFSKSYPGFFSPFFPSSRPTTNLRSPSGIPQPRRGLVSVVSFLFSCRKAVNQRGFPLSPFSPSLKSKCRWRSVFFSLLGFLCPSPTRKIERPPFVTRRDVSLLPLPFPNGTSRLPFFFQ